MNYKKRFKKNITETTVSYGGVWGNTSLGIGTHGGALNGGDWYAPGDSRNVFGFDLSKGKKKKRKKKQKMHLYKRAFMEALENEILVLNCALYCTDEYKNVAIHLLEKNKIDYTIKDEIIQTHGTDDQIHELLSKLIETVGEENFEENYLALIGEFHNFSSMLKKPKQRPKDYNQRAMHQGANVEKEHTTNRNLARWIAMNHLDEDPRYYEKLAKMEGKSKIVKSKKGTKTPT